MSTILTRVSRQVMSSMNQPTLAATSVATIHVSVMPSALSVDSGGMTVIVKQESQTRPTPLIGYSDQESGHLAARLVLDVTQSSLSSLWQRYMEIHRALKEPCWMRQEREQLVVLLSEVDAAFGRELSSLRTLSQSLRKRPSTLSSEEETSTGSSSAKRRMKTEENISMR